MTEFLLEKIRSNLDSFCDATYFTFELKRKSGCGYEQALIIQAFNDWELLMPVWFQIASAVDNIIALAQNSEFVARKQAWLLASKLKFFLQDYETALRYAMAAEEFFERDCLPNDSYVNKLYKNKMIEQAIDTYTEKRKNRGDDDSDYEDKNSKDLELEELVNQIFDNAIANKDYKLVLGLSLETKRIDVFKKIFESIPDVYTRLDLVVRAAELIFTPSFKLKYYPKIRDAIIEVIVLLDSEVQHLLLKSLVRMGLVEIIANIFYHMSMIDEKEHLTFQLAFLVVEYGSQRLIHKVCDTMEEIDRNIKNRFCRLLSVLRGDETYVFHHQFLVMRNQSDEAVIKKIRDSVRNACTHNAALIANGLMHMGTTSDAFLRDNLTWISTATNWNKFNAVASLGLIHKGNEANAKKVLEPYLPKENEQDIYKFKEGGALYAYGLIHANHAGDGKAINFLVEQLELATTPALRHGACLGLGLAAMGTHRRELYDRLHKILLLDEAVAGEAAGIAMGLIMAGSLFHECFDEMLQFMQDTRHDKIQHGLQIGIAMLAYDKGKEADEWIEKLLGARTNVVLRQAGAWMIAMAYVGDGKPTIINRLLTRFANDPNKDIKRITTTALGFLLCRERDQCLKYAKMLSNHFNGYARCGIALAVGLAFAGTGDKKAIELIEPLTMSEENYVRQSAYISLAFILIQHTQSSKVIEVRRKLMEVITQKDDTMAKFGAIIAFGILDAGGRSVTMSLLNSFNAIYMPAVLGTLVFLQYWYWHSTIPFIALSFRPTCLIGLNKQLKMPKLEFKCNIKGSKFFYPSVVEEKKENAEKLEAAVLSFTSKKLTKVGSKVESNKEKLKEKDATVSSEKATVESEKLAETSMETDKVVNKEKDDENSTLSISKIKEPPYHSMGNPARVTPAHLKAISFADSNLYYPLKLLKTGGIVILQKNPESNHKEEYVEIELLTHLMTPPDENVYRNTTEAAKPSTFEFDLSSY